jgi:hypothetical protein
MQPIGPAPMPRWGHEAVYHPTYDQMLVVGGFDGVYLADVWALQWNAATSVGDDPSLPFGDLRISSAPNPFASEARIRFTLPSGGATRVEVFDASGRRVRELSEAMLPLGSHEVSWRGDDDQRRALPSGTYFLRIAASGQTATQRVTIMR